MAFPQHGVVRTPGTRELLEEAVRTGAVDRGGGIDLIGFDEALPPGQGDREPCVLRPGAAGA